MPVTPGNYQRRVFNGSGLDTNARFVAVYLSRLAHSDADEFGWFEAPDAKIAEALAMHRTTVANRIDALDQSGWIEVQAVVAGNRYQATRYRLALPDKVAHPRVERRNRGHFTTENQPRKVSAPPTPRTESLMSAPPTTSVGPTDNEVLTSKVVGDGAAPSGGVGNDEKKIQPKPAPDGPAQPQAAGPPDAETQVFAGWDAERQEEQTAALATDFLAVPCADHHAEVGEPCPGSRYQPTGACTSRRVWTYARLAVPA